MYSELDRTAGGANRAPVTSMRAALPTVAAALAYTLLTVAMTYPLSVHPASTTFPGSSDRNLYEWTLAWDAHALLHQPLSIFDANIFYPYERTLAYSENLIGVALLVAPLQWLVQNPVLTMNVAALLSVPLCALGAFVLARRLGVSASAAFICGLVYGFAPPRFLRIDQAHLTAVQWIPFCLAFAHSYARSGRAYDLRLAVAFLSVQALSSGHGTVFLLVALAVWGVCARLAGGRLKPIAVVRDAGVWGAALLMPALLVIVPYRRVQIDVGLRRGLGDWTGSWTSFLSSPTHVDAFILDRLGRLGAEVAATTQAYLFPGWLPLALAAAALVWRPARLRRPWDRRRLLAWLARAVEGATLAVALTASYALATGSSRLEVLDVPVSLRAWWRPWAIVTALVAARGWLARDVPLRLPAWAVSAPHQREARPTDPRIVYLLLVVTCALLAIGPPNGPWRLVYWLPGLSFIRVPSRFMILGTLGIAVLCGYGFDRLTALASPGRRRLAAVAFGAALVAEFAVVPFEVVPNPLTIPAADRWLATQPQPFVVAEVPLMDPTIPMLHATAHWQKTVHGYSGWNPALSQELAAALATFPDPHCLAMLARVGVDYVVVHADMYEPAAWQAVVTALERDPHGLVLAYQDPAARVYALPRDRRQATGG